MEQVAACSQHAGSRQLDDLHALLNAAGARSFPAAACISARQPPPPLRRGNRLVAPADAQLLVDVPHVGAHGFETSAAFSFTPATSAWNRRVASPLSPVTCTYVSKHKPTALEEVEEPDVFGQTFLPLINR